MVGRKKANMLEAFEATGTRRAQPAASARAQGSSAAKAAPAASSTAPASVAPSTRALRPANPVTELSHAPLQETGFTLPFSAPTFLLIQLGLIGVAFFLGHQIGLDGGLAPAEAGVPTESTSAGSTLALGAAPGPTAASMPESSMRLGASQSRAEALEPESRASEVPRQPLRTPEEEAFHDPRNQFTVQAASYAGTHRELAEHWAGQLREAGFPALVHRVGPQYAIYVGADAGAIELESLVSRIKAWRAPDGTRPFATCRIVGLDGVR